MSDGELPSYKVIAEAVIHGQVAVLIQDSNGNRKVEKVGEDLIEQTGAWQQDFNRVEWILPEAQR